MFENKYPYTDFHELNLDWVLSKIREFGSDLDAINKFLDGLKDELTFIEELYKQIISGNFPPEVQNALFHWMKENAADVIANIIHAVFFGLTDDGYFIAYVPDSWDDIQFGTTGLDDFPVGIDYGHLTLTY